MTRNKYEPLAGFDVEELEQMDKLLGIEWVSLSDDELAREVQKALTGVTKAREASSGTIGSTPEIQRFFDGLIQQLNDAIKTGTKAASDRDAAAAYAPGPIGPALINSSPAPGAMKGIAKFLDDVSGKDTAELREALELSKTGRFSPAEISAVRKAVEESEEGRLIKNAAALLGGVRELARRGAGHSITLT
jgi:hypothetical protein